MKPSDMKKDKVSSVRINSDLLKKLKRKGITLQSIIDKEVDKQFSIDVKGVRNK